MNYNQGSYDGKKLLDGIPEVSMANNTIKSEDLAVINV
jgi:hypothetical protein